MVNRFELLGNVTHSPEFLKTAAGTPFCFLRMRTTRMAAGQERTDYHFITIWSAAIQRIAEELHVGDGVFVDGRIEASLTTRNDALRANTIRLIASRVVPTAPHRRDARPASEEREPIGTFVEAPVAEELPSPRLLTRMTTPFVSSGGAASAAGGRRSICPGSAQTVETTEAAIDVAPSPKTLNDSRHAGTCRT
jgi:single-stranded DNA-binding protein